MQDLLFHSSDYGVRPIVTVKRSKVWPRNIYPRFEISSFHRNYTLDLNAFYHFHFYFSHPERVLILM